MNLGGLLLLFLVIAAAIGGLYLITAKTPTGVTDTYGMTIGNESNESQSMVTNLTSTGLSVGTGALVLVALTITVVVLGALVYVAVGKKW